MFKATGMVASAIVCTILLLPGCSSVSELEQDQANVTSNPPGATVIANSLELGETPLHYNLYDAFPAGWENSTYQAQGVLTVKKDGCKDYTLKVNDYILRKPIHAELKCSAVNTSEKSTKIVTPPGETERRLEELEALYKKGVITKDEYKTTRERILSEL